MKKRHVLENKRRKQEELDKLKANFERLTTMTGGFARRGSTPKAKVLVKPVTYNPRYEEGTAFTKQNKGAHIQGKVKEKLELDPGMRARIGQVGNKMGLQYLTDLDLADSKKGLMLRR